MGPIKIFLNLRGDPTGSRKPGGTKKFRGDLVYALVKNGLITFGSKFSLLYIMVNIFRFNKIETPRSLLN